MCNIKKQNAFESEYSIELVSTIKGVYYSQINNEQGNLVWTQKGYSESRSDALDFAEFELNKMFDDSLMQVSE